MIIVSLMQLWSRRSGPEKLCFEFWRQLCYELIGRQRRIVFITKSAVKACARLVFTKAMFFICRYLCYKNDLNPLDTSGLTVNKRLSGEKLDNKVILHVFSAADEDGVCSKLLFNVS